MNEIEDILEKHPQTNQYRDGNKKVRFNLEWSMLLGHTTNALGAKSFLRHHSPHNFKQGRGVYIKPVEERKIPKWKKELWSLSKELISLVDPDFADGEFVVNYSCMTKPEQYVKKHDRQECPHASTHCAKPQRIATSPAFRRKSSSQQASVLESAPKRALYLSRSSTLAA